MPAKLFKNSEAQQFKIDGGTTGVIYPSHPVGEHTIARVVMKGVYPVIGYSINERCTETMLMIKGSYKVRVDEDVYELNEGDALVILPGTKYRVEGNGEALDLITPQWDKSQNKIVPDENFKI